MKICPTCNDRLDDDARFCPKDGTPLLGGPDKYIGKVFHDQFEIREVCGRGSMGTVYKAWQIRMERDVAIKVLRPDLRREPELVKRFHREARAAARLSHPNIITVYMVGETDDKVPFLAMEFVKGKSLGAVCDEEAPLDPKRAVNIASQIASALAEAHESGIVHRDLKPENIIVSDKPQAPDFVKVLDFGIAKILRSEKEGNLTQTGAIFGTPHYISPEQAAGRQVDHRSDLYALGVILYFMAAGQLPFANESGMGLLVQHIKEQPPDPRSVNPSLPLALCQMILKAMEKDPDHRFQTAEEMAKEMVTVGRELRTAMPTMRRVSGTMQSPEQYIAQATAEAAAPGAEVEEQGFDEERHMAAPLTLDDVEDDGEEEDESAETNVVLPVVDDEDLPEEYIEEQQLPSDIHNLDSVGLGLSTVRLQNRLLRRRRLLLNLLIGFIAVVSGSALGAILYYHNHRFDGLLITPAPAAPVEPSRTSPAEPEPKSSKLGQPDETPTMTALNGAGGASAVAPDTERPAAASPKPKPWQVTLKRAAKKKPAAKARPRTTARARPRPRPPVEPRPEPPPAEPAATVPPAGPDPEVTTDHGEPPAAPAPEDNPAPPPARPEDNPGPPPPPEDEPAPKPAPKPAPVEPAPVGPAPDDDPPPKAPPPAKKPPADGDDIYDLVD